MNLFILYQKGLSPWFVTAKCGKIAQFLQFFTPIFFSSGGRQLNVLAFYDRDAFLTLSAVLHYTTVV